MGSFSFLPLLCALLIISIFSQQKVAMRSIASMNQLTCQELLTHLWSKNKSSNSPQLWQEISNKDNIEKVNQLLDLIVEAKRKHPITANLEITESIEKLKIKKQNKIYKLLEKFPLGEKQLSQEELELFVHKFYRIIFDDNNTDKVYSKKIQRIIDNKLSASILSIGLEKIMSETFDFASKSHYKRFMAHYSDKFVRLRLNYLLTIFNNAALAHAGALPVMFKTLDFKIAKDDLASLIVNGSEKELAKIYRKYKIDATIFLESKRLRFLSIASAISLYFVFNQAYENYLEEQNKDTVDLFENELKKLDLQYEEVAKIVITPMVQDFIDSYHQVHGKNPSADEIEDFKTALGIE